MEKDLVLIARDGAVDDGADVSVENDKGKLNDRSWRGSGLGRGFAGLVPLHQILKGDLLLTERDAQISTRTHRALQPLRVHSLTLNQSAC